MTRYGAGLAKDVHASIHDPAPHRGRRLVAVPATARRHAGFPWPAGMARAHLLHDRNTAMKLVANMTLTVTQDGKPLDRTFNATKELGEAPSAQTVQHVLHQFLGSLVNDIAAHQASFRALAVTCE